MFSPEVLNLFASLLGQVQIPAAAQDFEEQVAVIRKARQELSKALTPVAEQNGQEPAPLSLG